MKLTSDSETLAENKALILYVLDKVGKPIDNNALLRLILSVENMNYFYFQQFLLDLIENKYIVNYTENNQLVYAITTEGKQALELVKDLIPGFLKFKIDNSFKENLHEIQNEVSITADFIPHSENDYSVKCKITEGTKVLFELETFAGSTKQAKDICNNWTKNADNIYPKILELLTNK